MTAHFMKTLKVELIEDYQFTNEFICCSNMEEYIKKQEIEELRNELLLLREKFKYQFEIPSSLTNNWFTSFTIENSIQNKESDNKLNVFSLPLELQYEILTFYSLNKVKDLLNLRLVCKEWNNIIISPQTSNHLWLQLCYLSIKNSALYPYAGKDDVFVYGPVTENEQTLIKREKNEKLNEEESALLNRRKVANKLAGKFTYSLFKEIAMKQQTVKHEKDLNGFQCWFENIGQHYAKKNDIASFLLALDPLVEKDDEMSRVRHPSVCVSLFLHIQANKHKDKDEDENEDEDENKEEKQESNKMVTEPNDDEKKGSTKFGGNPDLKLEDKPNDLGKFFGQLDLEQIAGQSMVHGGILPQTGKIYIFIKDDEISTDSEYSTEVETTLIYSNPSLTSSKEMTFSKEIISADDYPHGEVKKLQNGLAIKYEENLFPGHYTEWGYWKDHIARYFEWAMLSTARTSYSMFCPPLNVPFEQREDGYYNIVFCQNLEGTTALIMVDLTEIEQLFRTGKMVTQSKVVVDGCRYYAQNE